jgi:ammonium transporter, Amt family
MNGLDDAVVLVAAVIVPLLPVGIALVWGAGPRAVPLGRSVLGAAAVVAVLWVLVGSAIAFGAGGGIGVDGVLALDPGRLALGTDVGDLYAGTGSASALGRIALTGALALVPAAIAAVGVGSARRTPWLLFTVAWALLVVFPQLGWVFDVRYTEDGVGGGWLVAGLQEALGAGLLDFAGGTLHVAGGAAALALVLVVRREADPDAPSSDAVLLAGAVLLTLGASMAAVGAEGAADGFAALALLNTTAAAGTGALTGAAIARLGRGRSTSSAAAGGLVAGLAAAASAGPFIAPLAAVALGVLAAAACAGAGRLVARRFRHAALPAVLAHLGGGVLGLLYLGAFANDTGMAYSGRFTQLLAQGAGAGAVLLHAFVVAALLGLLLDRTLGFRTRQQAGAPAPGRAAD